jgi:hypothetical protein
MMLLHLGQQQAFHLLDSNFAIATTARWEIELRVSQQGKRRVCARLTSLLSALQHRELTLLSAFQGLSADVACQQHL